ncbi:MAG: mercury resistance system transport protein MerF [Rhizobiaceae bacterium]|nr:mercury resistance system transport protein MerF [Rhizobiaceae bacterium]
MNNNKMLATGLIGTVIAALCCFTPLLVIALGAVGLSAILGYLDYILLPALGLFILMTIFALYRRQS